MVRLRPSGSNSSVTTHPPTYHNDSLLVQIFKVLLQLSGRVSIQDGSGHIGEVEIFQVDSTELVQLADAEWHYCNQIV